MPNTCVSMLILFPPVLLSVCVFFFCLGHSSCDSSSVLVETVVLVPVYKQLSLYHQSGGRLGGGRLGGGRLGGGRLGGGRLGGGGLGGGGLGGGRLGGGRLGGRKLGGGGLGGREGDWVEGG